MSHHNRWAAALVALSLAGPALAADKNAAIQTEKQQVFAQAPYAVAGTVVAQPANGLLVLKPYGQQTQSTLQFDPSAPIFQGNGKISAVGLKPGTDIRVHYRPDAAQPRAMAVEVLSSQEASLAKQQPQQLATGAPLATPAPQAGAVVTSPLKDAALKNSSGNQAGKVKNLQLAQGTFVLDPYQKAAGDATLQVPASVQVFSGTQQLSTTALTPGKDVRVYYKTEGTNRPSIVAIELLNPQEAQQLEKAERDVPKK